MTKLSKSQKIFILLSALFLLTDLTFVSVNYHMAKQTFEQSLDELSAEKRRAYQLALNMELQNMLRMASFIAKDKQIQQLFWQGKQAVEQEGGGAGGKRAAQVRQQLLTALLPAWQHLQDELGIRQLHFHLGPGSLSFLRVHKPDKFGDRMDDVRHIIINTNKYFKSNTGFETGRIYSGLRGVVPVFAEINGAQEYVGALEVGTSFEPVFEVLGAELNAGIVVLLKDQHVKSNMWQSMIKEHFEQLSETCACLVEASSRSAEEVSAVLGKVAELISTHDDGALHTHVINWQGATAVTHFPLYDYQHSLDAQVPPVGRVMLWSDISTEVNALQHSLYTNIVLSMLAFMLVELLLYVGIRLLNQRLMQEIDDRTEDLRRSQNALQQANQRFASVLDGLDAIIYVADMRTYELLYVNRKLRQTLQAKIGDICWQVLQAGQTQPCKFCTNNKLIDAQGRAKATYVWEFQNTRSGDWLKCFDTAVPWGDDGHLVRLEIATDINSEKRREAELETAKQAAEAANRAKSAFLANMSHELRTPLNAVLGFAQILRLDKKLNAEQINQVQSIENGGEYLLTLINDVLDLAKIEAGRFELFPNIWHTEAFFNNLSQVFAVRAQQKGIQLNYQAAIGLPRTLYSDEKRLRQIVMNLLSNAIKFTEIGHVTLSTDFQNGHLLIHVEDSGIGMTQAEQDAVFSPFAQVGDEHYKLQGTGLGLSITQRLVKLMDGEISLESYPGQGSHFQISLPVEVVSSIDEAFETDSEKPSKIIGYQRDNGEMPLRLLVVEDIADNREVLRKLLEPLNFQLLEADSGEACLDLLKQLENPPDVVLMDLRLPGLDGFATTQNIHAQPQFADLPVIAVSASTFQENQQQALAAGCCAHVSKPVHLQALLKTLEQCCSLQLVYAARENLAAEQASEADIRQPLNEPQLKKLRHFTAMGDISSLNEYLKTEIQQATLEQQKSLQYLADLAQNFELDAIEEYLRNDER